MKSSDTTPPEPNNDETDNSQIYSSQSEGSEPERFDMSKIVETPRWKRILKAVDLPIQFVRIGLFLSLIHI